MNESKIIDFLKQNLKIEIRKHYDDWDEETRIEISLSIDGETICESSVAL